MLFDVKKRGGPSWLAHAAIVAANPFRIPCRTHSLVPKKTVPYCSPIPPPTPTLPRNPNLTPNPSSPDPCLLPPDSLVTQLSTCNFQLPPASRLVVPHHAPDPITEGRTLADRPSNRCQKVIHNLVPNPLPPSPGGEGARRAGEGGPLTDIAAF